MKTKLKNLMLLSFNEVEKRFYNGFVDERVWQAYQAVWNWSTFRWGGAIGLKHDAYYTKYGAAKYYAKINKVRAAFGFKPSVMTPENRIDYKRSVEL